MSSTRRTFLLATGALAAGVGAPSRARAETLLSIAGPQQQDVPQKDAGSKNGITGGITQESLADAERLAAVRFTDAERAQILESIDDQVKLLARRMEHFNPPNEYAPASIFDPRLPGFVPPHAEQRLDFSHVDPGPLPENEEDIAFAPAARLGAWLRNGAITSTALTRLYLRRLKQHGPKLNCVITLLEDHAMAQAAKADEELSAGVVRSPLHGVPWGGKDLLDTAGIATTYGAEPYRRRVPEMDSVVVQRLNDAGAVLVAKLSMGALAYGDIWFKGRTNNPFNVEQGSSGSSAGSTAATVAGLVGFSIGTETYGSIVSPCMRCGGTGLRPTFGRVARTGAMALCWSLDKIGPICRSVEDCMMVLSVINGADGGDPSSVDAPLDFQAGRDVRGLRIGFDPQWFNDADVNPNDARTIEILRRLGAEFARVEVPKMDYDILLSILVAEAASAFEEITLNNTDDQLVWQDKDAWPNTFRTARFIPAIEFVQADRFRRQVMQLMEEKFDTLDAIISPSFAGDLLLITNNTGHPSLTIRNGFNDDRTPNGITLWGRLYEEGTLCNIGMALEREFGVCDARPEL